MNMYMKMTMKITKSRRRGLRLRKWCNRQIHRPTKFQRQSTGEVQNVCQEGVLDVSGRSLQISSRRPQDAR